MLKRWEQFRIKKEWKQMVASISFDGACGSFLSDLNVNG